MRTALKRLRPVLAYAAANLDGDISLAMLARRAGISAFHLHRLFAAVARETPKQLTTRLRIERAAALLLTRRDSVLEIALGCGFQSHEVFCRAFRRRFGITPRKYRARGFARSINREQMAGHAVLVSRIGPCIRFYRRSEESLARDEMAYSITTKELKPQPMLVTERRMKQSEIGALLGEMFGRVFQYAQENGIALAGAPFARYLEMGPGLMKIQAGLPVVRAASSAGEVTADTLPGGLAALTLHAGSYDQLRDAHAAIQEWIEAERLTPAGPPWESYVTDPAEHPDPKDWKTEVYWPVRRWSHRLRG
jgi:AraC family transcriptional regulator